MVLMERFLLRTRSSATSTWLVAWRNQSRAWIAAFLGAFCAVTFLTVPSIFRRENNKRGAGLGVCGKSAAGGLWLGSGVGLGLGSGFQGRFGFWVQGWILEAGVLGGNLNIWKVTEKMTNTFWPNLVLAKFGRSNQWRGQ